ncbi:MULTISPECIES: hypothetical protein [unclassified Campylobacter]|uniref:hypothetical protein n=1 Tax=unclassified Campylobacter TaxID=2593542 RepID=UPI0012380BDC|nr:MULTISPECIES: hypothetical protein [unclassified Campylobacter]KAA6225128.1 hypothetical protein FMM55_07545 [Campylobacter sp. LR196d]KAA6226142.1 hypothetical protein FMM54_04925 [Campylobacter sp. LR185c]KAA6228090.1 hypothetical protein FMM57_03615 [Campylobacter sp. LR286c]KAA6231342.1 hypothetical protein FMM56_04065 [Campylobacter sp. LR264d]KAA6231554.1 hypothetical protein FMM58_02865 [Campylobacter sp. LR291e]
MKKWLFLILFATKLFCNVDSSNCTYVSADNMLFIAITHNCNTIVCDNIQGQFANYKTKKVYTFKGSVKGSSYNNLEFKFKNITDSYIIRQNELFTIQYNNLLQTTPLTPCNSNSSHSLQRIFYGKSR